MLNGLHNVVSKSNASIGPNSNQNTIVQNSNIIDPVVICTNQTEMIKTLGNLKAYDAIQQQAQDYLRAIKQTHPLFPVFSATYNNRLNALVSTPETADAFKQYPKNIKGKFRIDYSKYPYMDSSENPWEYAYRTQTPIELEATAYQEYLGDIEDPFPVTKYADGMLIQIVAPEFPPAVSVVISSGEVAFPCKMRRKSWMEYGQMCFETISDECGLNLRIIAYKDNTTDIKLTKTQNTDLTIQLRCEKLLDAMLTTKQFSITIDNEPLLSMPLTDNDLCDEVFHFSKYLIQYYESLLNIEKQLHCKFNCNGSDVSFDDYRAALILSASLDGKWHRIKTDFDNEFRCNYNRIPDDIFLPTFDATYLAIEGVYPEISLQGIQFIAEKYTACYEGARINNIKSVMKNKKSVARIFC